MDSRFAVEESTQLKPTVYKVANQKLIEINQIIDDLRLHFYSELPKTSFSDKFGLMFAQLDQLINDLLFEDPIYKQPKSLLNVDIENTFGSLQSKMKSDFSEIYSQLTPTEQLLLAKLTLYFAKLFEFKKYFQQIAQVQSILPTSVSIRELLQELVSFDETNTANANEVNSNLDLMLSNDSQFLIRVDNEAREFAARFTEENKSNYLSLNRNLTEQSIEDEIQRVQSVRFDEEKFIGEEYRLLLDKVRKVLSAFRTLLESKHATHQIELNKYNHELKDKTARLNSALINLKSKIGKYEEILKQIVADDYFELSQIEVTQTRGIFYQKIDVNKDKSVSYFSQNEINKYILQLDEVFHDLCREMDQTNGEKEVEKIAREIHKYHLQVASEITAKARRLKSEIERKQKLLEDGLNNVLAARRKEFEAEKASSIRRLEQLRTTVISQARNNSDTAIIDERNSDEVEQIAQPFQSRTPKQPGFIRRHWLKILGGAAVGAASSAAVGAGLGVFLGMFAAPLTFGLSIPVLAGIGAGAGALYGAVAGGLTAIASCKVLDSCAKKQKTPRDQRPLLSDEQCSSTTARLSGKMPRVARSTEPSDSHLLVGSAGPSEPAYFDRRAAAGSGHSDEPVWSHAYRQQ